MCVRLHLCLCGGDGLRHGERSEQVVLGGGASWDKISACWCKTGREVEEGMQNKYESNGERSSACAVMVHRSRGLH